MSEQFEKWHRGYRMPGIGDLGYQYSVALEMMSDAWNAALASRATGEMPERPQPFYYEDYDTKNDPVYLYLARTENAHFTKLEAQIAELRDQVELHQVVRERLTEERKKAEQALATAEESGIRKALEIVAKDRCSMCSDGLEVEKLPGGYFHSESTPENARYGSWPFRCQSHNMRTELDHLIAPLLPSAESASKEPK